MTDIKFRYRNKELGILGGYILSMYITMDMNGTLWFQDETMAKPTDVTDRYIKEQYIGKKDKNGKEVYCGDIVLDRYGRTMKVIWFWDSWVFELLKVDKTKFKWTDNFKWARVTCWFENGQSDIEIIGNIHDNPELLEVLK